MKETGFRSAITLFLCGDVMTGRGIDQILPHPGDPRIHEPFVRDARRYVSLADELHGPIPRPAGFSHIWGDALVELERAKPDARIVNLETAVTVSDDYWKGKGITYRMHPGNIGCITAAGIDVCTLANNHVMDWGYAGLEETIATLRTAGIKGVGAGLDRGEAQSPAVLEIPGKGRVLVFSLGSETSGIPREWGATDTKPGVNLLPDLSPDTARRVGRRIREVRRPGDIVVVSIHWGGNWGHGIPREELGFSRALIDEGGADLIHGHSSHHVKGIGLYNDRPILFGCGDFINDYEGIGGYEAFRGDLALMYLVRMKPESGALAGLRMVPLRMGGFRLNRASATDTRWLAETLSREGHPLGTAVEPAGYGSLELRW
jgi:poly-gamma-glutamate synthesis protein (capsule biosynthesis protein)